ncbi:MAG: tetratricopeptide repeat protein [Elusimicrobiaceae bacterium]|nr:tetratricopeptide repeat protein [Elusimicrobiaceae bacterium]
MRKLFVYLTLAVGFLSPLFAQENSSQAESFYRAGQYAQALAAYEQDLKLYPNNPYLYYNIGNCYFKMGSKGLAIANYYRAFKLNPRHADIRHNLELALSSGGDTLVPTGIPPAVHRAFFSLSLAQLKGIVCLVGWLVCLLTGIWLLTRKGGKLTLAAGIVFVACASWYYMLHTWEKQPLAVIAAPAAELRSGPGTNFPASASISQGHLVQVLDSKDQWQQVVVRSEGLKGWVESSALEHI